MERVRVSVAAKYLGVHPDTIRRWADEGKLPFVWVGTERRSSTQDLKEFASGTGAIGGELEREVLYVRASGTTGQVG